MHENYLVFISQFSASLIQPEPMTKSWEVGMQTHRTSLRLKHILSNNFGLISAREKKVWNFLGNAEYFLILMKLNTFKFFLNR